MGHRRARPPSRTSRAASRPSPPSTSATRSCCTLDDERLWQYPWIYFVEPGNLRLTDSEVPILREFLLRGGTLTFDDFHGPYEWDLAVRQLKRVFPDREIVELAPPHPIFTCFYRIDKYPQIPGLGSFFSGRTWEKGGFVPHLRAHPRRQRPADGADQLEHRHGRRLGVVERRGVSRLHQVHGRWPTRWCINEVVYTLTH